jgi:hypothetical protein
MPLQSSDLVMAALGIAGDAPPLALQPKLADGVHLRWAQPRARGFPWQGYFLFRRPHEMRGETCIAAALRGLPEGVLGTRLETPAGRLTSDAPLRVVQEFGATGLDLAGRAWLRLDLPPGEPGFRLDVMIGCRGGEQHELDCLDLAALGRAALPDPLVLDKVEFRRLPTRRRPGLPGLLRGVAAAAGLSPTAENEIVVTLPAAAQEAVFALDGGGTLLASALDEAGNAVAKLRVKQDAVLRAETPFRQLRLAVAEGTPRLTRLCWRRAVAGRTRLRVVALDDGMEVDAAVLEGAAGDRVSATLRADRVTALRIEGGPAVLLGLCVRPVLAGVAKDWSPLPDCPHPLALPVRHPDHPANAGAEDAPADEAEALGRIRYGQPADWQAGFPDLRAALLALVKGGPAGPPMADPARAETGIPGQPAIASPGVAAPTVPRLHPLDLVLAGALHPPVAQMLGLYWADETAQPGALYDYLVVAADGLAAQGGAEAVREKLQRDPASLLGWICFARGATPATPVPAPARPAAYALPGATLRPAGPPDAPVRNAAGNVGLAWAADADPRGYLRPGAAVFHHVWRDRQGNAAAPAPSADANELATASGPVLAARPAGISTAPPQRPSGWPPFALQWLDFALPAGWYGYRIAAIDLFGRISAKSPFAAWRHWSPERELNPASVRLRDETPPPPPAALEAWALDPADPMTQRDAAHDAWRAGLPAAQRDTLVGLRVRWRWSVAQQRQAPDCAEFRIYLHPGTQPPPGWDNPAAWQHRGHVVAIGAATRVLPDGDRLYDVFLPAGIAGEPFAAGIPLAPTRAQPSAFAQVTVTAADAEAGIADRWPGAGRWAARPGNEGRPAAPARIVRILRTPPPPPEPVVDGPRAYATPADWNGHSFHGLRWRPLPDLRCHVLRAMDEAVFQADWARRPRGALNPNDAARFPDPAAEPPWTAAKRAAVAAALDALDALRAAGATREAALSAYRALEDDALRVLAGLPGNERAFTQVTLQPLDPADPATADARGPDDAANYAPRPALRRFLDRLDGRARNRYLYRTLYVDRAENRGPPGPVGTPVRLPRVAPPRAPVVTKVLAGERAITLHWASNREPDLLEYRVFRAATAAEAADLRGMAQVAVVAAAADPAARPASVAWTDAVPGLRDFFYRVVAVDRPDPDPRGGGGNVSAPSAAVKGRAVDTLPPTPPAWLRAERLAAGPVELAWRTDEADVTCRVQRRLPGGVWRDASPPLAAAAPPFDFAFTDPAPPLPECEYRVLATDAAGNVQRDAELQRV